MYSPLLFEMLAQGRTEEVAAAAEARRAIAERVVFEPSGERGLVRYARLLALSAGHAVQHVLLALRESASRAPLLRPPSASSR
jgi:hypothetical protein